MPNLFELLVVGVLLLLIYQLQQLPKRVNRYLRSFAAEYKRWADRDSEYERVLREERELSFADSLQRMRHAGLPQLRSRESATVATDCTRSGGAALDFVRRQILPTA